jgi:adenylate cyclase
MGKERDESADFWHKTLIEGEKPVRMIRTVFRRLPSSPRCKLCFAPFAGVGGRILRVTGEFAPSRKNPTFCNG